MSWMCKPHERLKTRGRNEQWTVISGQTKNGAKFGNRSAGMMQYWNTIRRTVRLAAVSVLAVSSWAPLLGAQVSSYGDKQIGLQNTRSRLLDKVGIAQHLNEQLPLNLTFTDDAGKQVQLASYFGRRPAIQ